MFKTLLGKQVHVIKKDVFRLLTKKKISMRNRTSDLRTPRSEALPLSHRDSTEIKIDVFRLVTSVGQRKNSKSPWVIEPQTSNSEPEFFLCPTLVTRRKTSFFISLPSSKLTISLIFPSTNITLSTLLILAVCRTRVLWTSL